MLPLRRGGDARRKRQYDDRDVFADIISVDQVHFIVLNSVTSAARTTSTSDAREIRRTSRAVRTTLFDRMDGSKSGSPRIRHWLSQPWRDRYTLGSDEFGKA